MAAAPKATSSGRFVRLGDDEIVEVHAQLAGIDRIQSMLGIDEGAHSTLIWADTSVKCWSQMLP